ncbi:MAG: thiamine diphosphokinase [Rhodobacteraceae bacterium]|nr:thiamine diphosphokinase [Paracoccaceae bacterium]
MNQAIVQSSHGVTLVGGAPVAASLFRMAIQRAPRVVAADGGADRCLARGVMPEAVVGDMDSISASARTAVGPDRLHPIAEQDSTDFDKVMRSVVAPFVIGLGFLGARVDHELSAFNTLVRSPAVCILLGAQDVVFHLPERFDIDLRRGDRFSLFPLMPMTAHSDGLHWPLDGIAFAPGGRVGTSNRVSEGRVKLALSGPGMLCILPKNRLDAVLQALTTG